MANSQSKVEILLYNTIDYMRSMGTEFDPYDEEFISMCSEEIGISKEDYMKLNNNQSILEPEVCINEDSTEATIIIKCDATKPQQLVDAFVKIDDPSDIYRCVVTHLIDQHRIDEFETLQTSVVIGPGIHINTSGMPEDELNAVEELCKIDEHISEILKNNLLEK